MYFYCEKKPDIQFIQNPSSHCIQSQNHLQLVFLQQGCFSLKINGSFRFLVGPTILALRETDRIACISPFLMHSDIIRFHVSFLNPHITYSLIHDNMYRQYMDLFGFVPLEIFTDRHENYFGAISLNQALVTQISLIFSNIQKLLIDKSFSRWSCVTRIYLLQLLELLHQTYCLQNYKDTTPIGSHSDNLFVANIMEYIHCHCSEPLSLQSISKEFHINKSSLSAYFRKYTGLSVMEYVAAYRIKCAQQALATTGLNISYIAQETGFNSESYFIKVFHAKVGVTPRKYRLEIQKKRKMEFGEIHNSDTA